jgi:hypothetical protein
LAGPKTANDIVALIPVHLRVIYLDRFTKPSEHCSRSLGLFNLLMKEISLLLRVEARQDAVEGRTAFAGVRQETPALHNRLCPVAEEMIDDPTLLSESSFQIADRLDEIVSPATKLLILHH